MDDNLWLIRDVDDAGLSMKTAKMILSSIQNDTMSGAIATMLLHSIVRKKILQLINEVNDD